MSTSSSQKYVYCPGYDSFLCESKQKLQERLVHHHNLREPLIHKAVANTIAKIEDLGYTTFIDEIIADYNASFINHKQINKYIDEYCGPEISDKYISNFDDPSSKMYRKKIGFDKFHKDAVNWQDQSSYKVTGKYFFAKHITNIRKYLTRYCKSIMNISEDNRSDLINYSCIYCAVQLLSTKIKFKRSKPQPLIRHTTLRDSTELHNSFKILYNALDLAELKSIVKRNNKLDPTRKAGNKYRVNSNSFAANLGIYASNLLNKESNKMGLSLEDEQTDDDDDVPDYFRDNQSDSTDNAMINMDVDNNDLPPVVQLNNNYIPAPPKPSPPPKQVVDCVCATHETFCDFPALPAPVMHRDGSRTVFVPLRVNEYGHPIPNYYYPQPYYTSYRNQRGGRYMGSTRYSRYNPYNNMYNYGYQDVPVLNLPVINNNINEVNNPMIDNRFNSGYNNICNYEDPSITPDTAASPLSYSPQSQSFENRRDYFNSVM